MKDIFRNKLVIMLTVLFAMAVIVVGYLFIDARAHNVGLTTRTRFYYGRIKEYFELADVMNKNNQYTNTPIKIKGLIAHGGGGFEGSTYTESLNALNSNYEKGFRFFELDVDWTTDNQLVLLHDWNRLSSDFETNLNTPTTLDSFLKLKSRKGWQQISISQALSWLKDHPDSKFIIDTKVNNRVIEMLTLIKSLNPKLTDRLIPQIFAFNEYDPALSLGYKSLILALHYKEYSESGVVRFAKSHPLSGVSMVEYHARDGLAKKLDSIGVDSLTHPINDSVELKKLKALGIDSVYTDWLDPTLYN